MNWFKKIFTNTEEEDKNVVIAKEVKE